MTLGRAFLLALIFSYFAATSHVAHFKYIRQGNPQDLQTHTDAGVAMMGGGSDLDEAFQWLCGKANGGDFLILRAHGGAGYNPYVSTTFANSGTAFRRLLTTNFRSCAIPIA